MTSAWMVRAGKKGVYSSFFESKDVVAIGWPELGDLWGTNEQRVINKYKEIHAHENNYTTGQSLSVILSFAYRIKKDDLIVTYIPGSRKYIIGKDIGKYSFSSHPNNIYGLSHFRKVEWLGYASRDKLSPETKSHLNATRAIFELKDFALTELIKSI